MPQKRIPAKKKASPSVKKVIIVHKRALEGKYGKPGYIKIEAALDRLIAHDKTLGITTTVALVDKSVPEGGVKATVPSKAGKFKAAIDVIYKSKQPDYLLLLGGPDVIPHISLRNPWGADAGFGEEDFVDSDLPYASNSGHSLDATKFLDAPRQVGRLPDVPSASDPSYLINRIRQSIKAPQIDPTDHFSLSAEVWKGASKAVAAHVFGAGAKVHCCPSMGPKWPSATLKKPVQYINCHGDTRKTEFYGERAGVQGELPHAINTVELVNKVAPGALVVAECCYGAELFEPRLDEPQGMALSYFEQGAATFLGSSTVSYGGVSAADLACADEICQIFFEGVFAGQSCGQALAEARRNLVVNQSVLDNYQIKTLAQFMLLGDPARQPVKATARKTAKKAVARKALRYSATLGVEATLVRKSVASVPVASNSVGVDREMLVQSIPMPAGVEFRAKLFTPDRPPAAKSTRLRSSGLARKFRMHSKLNAPPAKPSVLVVSIPNNPEIIAQMRQAWGPAEVSRTRTVRMVASSAVITQEVGEIEESESALVGMPTTSNLDKFLVQRRAPNVMVSAARPTKRRAPVRPQQAKAPEQPQSAGAGAQPERNRHVALVARIANGQIQSYKVLVAR